MQQPKVSVVLCTYNGAAFLAEQLVSIIGQTYPLHEVIVVDDGSADNTTEILAQFAAQYPVIRWQQNETNVGYNKNFEKALSLASGDVLAIADQDDVWHLQKIEILIQHWPKGPLLIYSDSVLFSGAVPQHPKPGKLMNRLWGSDPKKFALYNSVSGHAMLLRRELLQLALPFNPDVYYDWWLAVVAACNGGITYHPQILVFQRRHQQNASLPPKRSKSEILRQERSRAAIHLKQFCEIPNLSKEDAHFFKTLYTLWCAPMERKLRKDLFFFLMKNRTILYSSKNRLFPFLTHIKRSLRYAFKEA